MRKHRSEMRARSDRGPPGAKGFITDCQLAMASSVLEIAYLPVLGSGKRVEGDSGRVPTAPVRFVSQRSYGAEAPR